jgi:hypothetical protein
VLAASLLRLSAIFASHGWFEAACQVAHIRPRVLLESVAPQTLIALARTGHGIAVVPSPVRIPRAGVRAAVVMHRGVSIGRWAVAAWDAQRFLPPYAVQFVDELVAHCRRGYPGHEYARAHRRSRGQERRSANQVAFRIDLEGVSDRNGIPAQEIRQFLGMLAIGAHQQPLLAQILDLELPLRAPEPQRHSPVVSDGLFCATEGSMRYSSLRYSLLLASAAIALFSLSFLTNLRAQGARETPLSAQAETPAAPPAGVPETPPQPTVTILGSRQAQSVLGKEVRSSADENMGRIVDVIVDHDGRVRAAVIDFGGFLGVGSRKIAVDWNALSFPPPASGRDVVTLELTRDQVKAAPEYKDKQTVVVLGAAGSLQSLPPE